MEIILDQVREIEDELNKHYGKYELVMKQLARQRTVSDCYEDVLSLIGKVLIDASFCYHIKDIEQCNRYDGRTFRMFNGKYYKTIKERVLQSGMKSWLQRGGVQPMILLKMDRRINETITNYVMMKRLQPRLTLMCFENGVVDFTEKWVGTQTKPKLHEFEAKYDVIKQYDFRYDPDAWRSATLWRNFLGESVNFKVNEYGVLPESVKRHQLQMFLGSCLADRETDRFEYFMILQGDGANGKSVIFRVLESLFGKEEVTPIDLGQFARQGDERLRAAASLEGKRLMFCPEENLTNTKAFRYIKQLASGESIAMRKIGGNIQEIQSPPIIMLNTNHKYKAGDFLVKEDINDQSMTRRVQIINFEKVIPVHARDTNLSARMKKEKAGIFAWILNGYLRLKKNGFRMPESKQGQIDLILEKARGKVMMGNKQVNGTVALYVERKFIKERRVPASYEMDIRVDELYKNFSDFVEKEGLTEVSMTKFAIDLSTIGFIKWKNEKSLGGDGKTYYKVYCVDEYIHKHFIDHLPSIVDEADCELFEGEDFEEEMDEEGVYVE